MSDEKNGNGQAADPTVGDIAGTWQDHVRMLEAAASQTRTNVQALINAVNQQGDRIAEMRPPAGTSLLAAALAKAQGEMKNAAFNAENPHFKSKYATLAAVRDAVTPALSKHGLAVTQTTHMGDDHLFLTTTLLHSSGESIESIYPLPQTFDKPQIMGSFISYARRYQLAMMTGTASDSDDDGSLAQSARLDPPTKAKKRSGDPDWKGPLLSHALETEMRRLDWEVRHCTEDFEIDAILKDKANKSIIAQCKVDREAWLEGDDELEITGLKRTCEMMRAEIEMKNSYGIPADADNPQSYNDE